jgi:hypothetical protein
MEMRMSNTNNLVFTGVKIVAWIIFVGLCIEAGGLLVNFFFSLFKPEFVKNLYQKLDLHALYQQSKWAYFALYSFILSISILKTLLFYVVIMLVSNFDLLKPFNEFVSRKILLISYYTLSIGLMSYIGKESAKNIGQFGMDANIFHDFWGDSEAFILMAAVIYMIALIFKKGIDLQNENDLTV